MSRFIIHSQNNFWVWGEVGVNDHFCIHECPVALAPCKIEKILLPPLNHLGALFIINSPHTHLCFLDPTICSYAKTPLSDYSRLIGSPQSSSENPPGRSMLLKYQLLLPGFILCPCDLCQGEVSTIPRCRAWKNFLALVLKVKSLGEQRHTA